MIPILILSVVLSVLTGTAPPNSGDVGGGVPTATSSVDDVGGGIPTH